MVKVAFAGSFAARLVESVRARVAAPCDVVVGDEAGIPNELAEVDVLVSMGFSRAMAEAAPRLKLVQVPGAGLDRIERSALGPGVFLANAHGHETGIAEYVVGAMLTMTRSFGRLDAKLRRGEWESQWAVGAAAPVPWPELAGKTLGILGYGHIGQALARRARAFDMEVRAIRHRPDGTTPPDLAFLGGREHLDDLLARADYLAITVSLSPDTANMIGGRELALLKPTALVVNVARAEVIDEAALFDALAAKRIAGAALDVWRRYPSATGPTFPSALPFHELENVLMTPHVSGWTGGMLEARAIRIATNIDRVASGQPPLDPIGPES